MGCNLDQEELAMIEYLVRRRCLSEKHSISIMAIKRDMRDRMKNPEDICNSLVAKGLLGCKKKKAKNHFASPGPCIRALAKHGKVIWRGGRGEL